MLRPLLVSAALLLVPPAAIAPIAPAAAAEKSAKRCDDDGAKKRKKSMFGSVLGGIAGSAIGGHVGGLGYAWPVGSLLSDAIMALLDCKEQKQAAAATDEAVRGGVGSTATWESESRPGVKGSSTVSAEEKLANGGHCLTVTDVVIVDGEETTVPKKMCREPGKSGYARV
jgi:surface antigen